MKSTFILLLLTLGFVQYSCGQHVKGLVKQIPTQLPNQIPIGQKPSLTNDEVVAGLQASARWGIADTRGIPAPPAWKHSAAGGEKPRQQQGAEQGWAACDAHHWRRTPPGTALIFVAREGLCGGAARRNAVASGSRSAPGQPLQTHLRNLDPAGPLR